MNQSNQPTPRVDNSSSIQEPWYRRQCLLLIVGGSGVVILGAGLLVGLGFLIGSLSNRDQPLILSSDNNAPAPDTPVVVPTNTPAATPSPTLEPSPTPRPAPEIGSIIFAPKVAAGDEPINPANSFEAGITEIHAVFDYKHMSPDYTWERVWYREGKEMLRTAEPWTGAETGQFDYFLDTGGQALPAGQWVLDLYVGGELLATGEFTIESPITPSPTATPRLSATPSPTSSATPIPLSSPPARTYQLVYSKWDGSTHNLYLADTNGNNEQLLFTRAAGPSWSPNKKRLFFLGTQGVNQQMREGRVTCEFGTISDGLVAVDVPAPLRDICQVQFDAWSCERKRVDLQSEPSDVCTANGVSIYQNLDWKEGTARWASASPDGEAVAFDARPGGDTYRIYFRAMLGTSQQFRFEILGEQGSWAPDGQRMVYRSGRDNKQGLWISNRDDSGHTLVTNDGTDSFPAWSPDGRTIVFSRTVNGNMDIYAMNADGSNLRRLTEAGGHNTLPVYTPGGEIIFRSDRSGSWGIWKMSGNGSNQQQIIPNADVGPDWAYSKMDVK